MVHLDFISLVPSKKYPFYITTKFYERMKPAMAEAKKQILEAKEPVFGIIMLSNVKFSKTGELKKGSIIDTVFITNSRSAFVMYEAKPDPTPPEDYERSPEDPHPEYEYDPQFDQHFSQMEHEDTDPC